MTTRSPSRFSSTAERPAAARRSSAFTEWDGNLGAAISLPSVPLSPTRLESWASCGFRYFLAHVLGLTDRDDPERILELSALDRGSAVHETLERFVAEAIPNPPGLTSPGRPPNGSGRTSSPGRSSRATRSGAGQGGPCVGNRSGLTSWPGSTKFLYVEERHRAATLSVPIAVELRFGMGEAPPVVLELPSGRELAFRGVADRIDRADDGEILVSDYTTGRGDRYTSLERDPFGAGTTLQLGLYAEAAVQLLGARGTSSHYWMVEPRGAFRRFGYRWDPALRERFIEVLQTIVDGIDHGSFPAVPGEWSTPSSRTHDNCRYCEFDIICPVRSGRAGRGQGRRTRDPHSAASRAGRPSRARPVPA